MNELENAWKFREKFFASSEAIRVFYGPGEGTKYKDLAIDRFGDHYWITEWASGIDLTSVRDFLNTKGAKSAVHLLRPERGVPGDPKILLGEPPEGFSVREGDARFWIQMKGVKHPGLFLDHAPLRQWLTENSRDLTVLNTFSYTGSLSVAAGMGGASQVTTLDLSKPTIEWAKKNWSLNQLSPKAADFIFGDYFEWLPKLTKNERTFDLVIVDPPSFSRGKKGTFSTSKDLERLHEAAFRVLEKGGVLVTSINSANISRKAYFYQVQSAAKSCSRKIEIIREVEFPQTFPTRTSSEEDRYLKGWILKSS